MYRTDSGFGLSQAQRGGKDGSPEPAGESYREAGQLVSLRAGAVTSAGNVFVKRDHSYRLVNGATIAPPPIIKLQFTIKRVIDIVGAGVGLIVLLPLLIAITIAIRLDSQGPIIFWQIRWGKHLRKVRIYKFRTMRADLSDRAGIRQVVPNDSRVTRVGAFLRKTNLDELPQLFNILIGDMSFVGPRCHPIGMLAAGMPYEKLVPRYHERHAMLPGLTGLAQAKGFRGPTVNPVAAKKRIALDLHYVNRFSLWLDLKIVALTLWREARRMGNGL
jgi:polysaccharide biosynthesis protein PslA